jgi:hypothetical protein
MSKKNSSVAVISLKRMYESGELAKLFEAKGINFKAKN